MKDWRLRCHVFGLVYGSKTCLRLIGASLRIDTLRRITVCSMTLSEVNAEF
jgi:hypothetical protein